MALAVILLVPGLAALWTTWQKIASPLPPEPITLSVVGAGALLVNVTCAFILARFRKASGSLTKAAFLSARNDAYANIAIIAAGLLTASMHSIWPDIIVGLGIAAMNAGAAKEVWEATRARRDVKVSRTTKRRPESDHPSPLARCGEQPVGARKFQSEERANQRLPGDRNSSKLNLYSAPAI